MKHIIIDFEMNPIMGQRRMMRPRLKEEIIQIGAVMLDENYKEIASFSSLIKPQHMKKIFPRIREITGISTDMVKEADEFKKVFQEFLQWCNKYAVNYRIYSWGSSDVRQLKEEVKAKKFGQKQQVNLIINRWEDLQKTYVRLIGYNKDVSLVNALKDIEKDFEGIQHNALTDARNTAEVLRFIRHQKRHMNIITPLRMEVKAQNIAEEKEREELKKKRLAEKARQEQEAKELEKEVSKKIIKPLRDN